MFNHSGIFIDLNSGKVTQTKGVRHNVSEMLLLFSFETQCLFSCFCFFYWNIIYLQFCVSFRYIKKWISYTYPLLNILFPYRSLQSYRKEFPVLYSRFSLVIYFIYKSVYMSVSIFQFILPPTLPLGTIDLFSTSVTLFLFCK